MPDWLCAIQAGRDVALSDGALANLTAGIWNLVDGDDLDQLDTLLCRIDLKNMSASGIEALLRHTYSLRTSLDAWGTLLDKASREIESRSLDADTILKGLR